MLNFLKRKDIQKAKELEVFFITFDEPLKEVSWEKLKKSLPQAQRVDSVKGFDRAHKVCAKQAKGRRFISIDGDNELLPEFHTVRVSGELMDSPYVLSWAAVNSINGLCYGNGGVKCWPTELVHEMSCHENAKDEKSAVDFCFQLQYYLMPETLTVSNIHHTPYQAFRSGFREGIKMSLVKGEVLKLVEASELVNFIPKSNLERLRIWCSIGQDVENGLWAIYGARLGLAQLYLSDMALENIRDYDWFNNYWASEVLFSMAGDSKNCLISADSWDEKKLLVASEKLKDILNEKLNLKIRDYSPEESKQFKNTYVNRERKGLLK